MHARWIRLLGAVFALALFATACGGEEEPPADENGGTTTESPSDAGDGGGGADLTTVDFGFSPTELSVTEGQTISVTNIGETSHTFTTDDEAIDETIPSGETVEITLTGVTSGGFHCRFHPQMVGTLTVG
ncbi:MAG TPA: cupredoxin domain-containing protein [Actinomycetota bacterium]|nr:cupredoxin domain-containing protein [Actinomycetota bacterium]